MTNRTITPEGRITFAKVKQVIDYPDFLDVQLESFREFFQLDTTSESRANEGLFNCTMTLPSASKHCGMSQKEMKLTFFEYLKYHPIIY